MRVMVELSLYPLASNYIEPIKTFIERLHTYDNVQIMTTSTSTQLAGEYDHVMAILGKEMQRTHEEVGQAVFVAKFLNYEKMNANKAGE